MPTTGWLMTRLPVDPQNGAPPKLNTPPSLATVQYPSWLGWATQEAGSGAGGAGGGGPDGPSKAATPLLVPTRMRPRAAEGEVKLGTVVPTATCWTVCPLKGSMPKSV